MPPGLVELQNVSICYAGVQALKGVDLEIGAGEMVTVIGESGCGKSTLGRAVLGLVRPSAGEVRYQGQNIWLPGFRMPEQLRLSVQVVHQDSYASLNPVQRVRQILGAPLRKHAKAGSVEEMLQKVGLTPPEFFANKYPFQLSGGQRQRVSIARAALLKPRLIVADEPVSGVDATLRLSILRLMRRLCDEEGISFLYITHDLTTARMLNGRLLCMYLGRVVEQGPVQQLLEQPRHPYLQALLAALPPLDPRRARQAQPLPLTSLDMPDPRRPPSGCAFHPRCPHVQEICRQKSPVLEQGVACHVAKGAP